VNITNLKFGVKKFVLYQNYSPVTIVFCTKQHRPISITPFTVQLTTT